MVVLTILDHNFAQFSELNNRIKKLLSYKTKSYNSHTNKYIFSTQSLVDLDNLSTYSGLVPFIQQNISDIKVIDQRIFPPVEFRVPSLTKDPREYQIDYFESALKERRMIFHSITASGKTYMMAMILDGIPLPTLIIAPTKTVMAQLKTELKLLLPSLDLGEASGEKLDLKHNVVIGLAQTLIKVPPEQLQKFPVLLQDEAHTSPAQQCHDVILAQNASYRFGFTGTPTGRSDNRDLVIQGLFGKIIQLIDRVELIDQGYVADTDVEMYRGWWGGNFHAMEDLLISKNTLRNELIKKIVDKSHAHSVLILVRRKEHGTTLQQMFGSQSIFIDGDSDMAEREDVRRDIKNGRYRILIASNIFGTGLDIPQLELGVFAAGGKAEIGTAQGIGRVVRPWNEMAKLWVDIYDEYCHTMEEHSKERMKIYHKQGVPVQFIGFPPGKERQLKKELDDDTN